MKTISGGSRMGTRKSCSECEEDLLKCLPAGNGSANREALRVDRS